MSAGGGSDGALSAPAAETAQASKAKQVTTRRKADCASIECIISSTKSADYRGAAARVEELPVTAAGETFI